MNLAFALCGGLLVGIGMFSFFSNLIKRGNKTDVLLAILFIFLGFNLSVTVRNLGAIVQNNTASEAEQNYADETAVYEEAVTDGYTVYINGMETNPENIDFDAFLRTGDIAVTYNDDAKKILITRKG